MSIQTIFANVNGASFVGLDTLTEPALNGGKKNPHRGRITKKITGMSVMVFQNKNSNAYENMVNRRLAEECKGMTFEVGPRTWGERIPNTPFVRHTKDGVEELYLEIIALNSGKVEYFLDGAPIAKEDIIDLKEKSEGEQGGLDRKVPIRTFKVSSLTAIRIDGKEYVKF